MQSFKNPQKRNTTTLAQYVWNHALNPNPNIKWEILKNCSVYRPGNKACDLCICEKLAILQSTNNPLNINKRNDIGGRCIHRRCCALDNITWTTPKEEGCMVPSFLAASNTVFAVTSPLAIGTYHHNFSVLMNSLEWKGPLLKVGDSLNYISSV